MPLERTNLVILILLPQQSSTSLSTHQLPYLYSQLKPPGKRTQIDRRGINIKSKSRQPFITAIQIRSEQSRADLQTKKKKKQSTTIHWATRRLPSEIAIAHRLPYHCVLSLSLSLSLSLAPAARTATTTSIRRPRKKSPSNPIQSSGFSEFGVQCR